MPRLFLDKQVLLLLCGVVNPRSLNNATFMHICMYFPRWEKIAQCMQMYLNPTYFLLALINVHYFAFQLPLGDQLYNFRILSQ